MEEQQKELITIDSELQNILKSKNTLEKQFTELAIIESYLNSLKSSGYIFIKEDKKEITDKDNG